MTDRQEPTELGAFLLALRRALLQLCRWIEDTYGDPDAKPGRGDRRRAA